MKHVQRFARQVTAGPGKIFAIMDGPAWNSEPNLVVVTVSSRDITQQRSEQKYDGTWRNLADFIYRSFPGTNRVQVILDGGLTSDDARELTDKLLDYQVEVDFG